jgi:NAD(P)-dependent dehydrogenase (short-subunit alcohol dehydrogenase family)
MQKGCKWRSGRDAGTVTSVGARQPDDIAPVAVFLASDESRWVTGDTLAVSGGLG